MIKRSIISILLIINCFLLHSQIDSESYYNDSLSQSDSEQRLFGGILDVKENVNGNPYYLDWSFGDIRFNNGEIIHNKKIRYNGYLDELIWMEGIMLVKLEKPIIEGFSISDPKRIFKKIRLHDPLTKDSSDIFMEVLYENKLSLLAYRRIKQIEQEVVVKATKTIIVDNIAPRYIYYFKLPNKKLVSFSKIKRRSLFLIAPEKKSSIRKLLRQNHLSLNTETDMIEAVKLIQKTLL